MLVCNNIINIPPGQENIVCFIQDVREIRHHAISTKLVLGLSISKLLSQEGEQKTINGKGETEEIDNDAELSIRAGTKVFGEEFMRQVIATRQRRQVGRNQSGRVPSDVGTTRKHSTDDSRVEGSVPGNNILKSGTLCLFLNKIQSRVIRNKGIVFGFSPSWSKDTF